MHLQHFSYAETLACSSISVSDRKRKDLHAYKQLTTDRPTMFIRKVSTSAAMPTSQPKQGDIPEKTTVLRSALSFPHRLPHTPPPLPISCTLSHLSPFFQAHLWAVKSCFVLCGGLWKWASRVKVGQWGGIVDDGGGGEERERESEGLFRVKDWERERKERGREGYVTHRYSVNLSKVLREKLCRCCLGEQVTNTHIHMHTRVTSMSQVT